MIENITQENIQKVVVEGSLQKTVLLYIFDPQNPQFAPITNALEQQIGNNNSYITLAKADVSDPTIQSISYQLQIMNLPAICVFSGGRPIDIIPSDKLQIINEIPSLIASYMPSQEQILISEALNYLEKGQISEAFASIQQAYQMNTTDVSLKFTYIDIAIKAKKIKEARAALETIDPANQQTQTYKDLLSALTLAEENQHNPEMNILENEVKNNPDNLEAVQKLATAWNQEGKNEEALELLLSYLTKDLNASNGEIKKLYLDIIATINGDPLQPKYRRKLYNLLY